MAKIYSRDKARVFELGRPITPAMRDILNRLGQGESPQEIAYARGTSVRTIDMQLAAIRGRLGAKNTVHAMAIWVQRVSG
ncbi:MAG: LuxR C-terminal-related transcriptional regulator [Rickettsiales bacterium]